MTVASGSSDPWEVITYEVRMLREAYEIVLDQPDLPKRVLANAVEESAVLHSRILCDLLFGKKDKIDDVIISEVFVDWNTPRYDRLRTLSDQLKTRYSDTTPGTTYSPYSSFNKLMAHLTSNRGTSYNYKPHLVALRPLFQEIITELEMLSKVSFGKLGDPMPRRP